MNEKRPDNEVFTNQLIIEIDKSRVDPKLLELEALEKAKEKEEPDNSDVALAKEIASFKKSYEKRNKNS